jgi:hypothetical protein
MKLRKKIPKLKKTIKRMSIQYERKRKNERGEIEKENKFKNNLK